MALEQKDEEVVSVMELIKDELEEDDYANNCCSLESLQIELEYENEVKYTFDGVIFPNLKTLDMSSIEVDGINFTKQAFPKLESLTLCNINCDSQDCDFNFDLPKLQSISISHTHCEDTKNFANSINKSVLLETFFNYKFYIYGSLSLALPNIKQFIMARSELITSLSLWAPKLDKLTLRSNWDLKTVRILKNAPKALKKFDIPKSQYSKFNVELIYCDPKINADDKRIKKLSKKQPEQF